MRSGLMARVKALYSGMLAQEDIARMSRAERLDAMELLWLSSSTDLKEYPSPSWHGEVLEQRAEKMKSEGPGWLSIDELEARLSRR